MKQILLKLTKEDIDNMILLKWGKPVTSIDNPAFLSNHIIGKIYGIDGSSVRRLYMKRFIELNDTSMYTRKKKKS